jgi:hypothetical protein
MNVFSIDDSKPRSETTSSRLTIETVRDDISNAYSTLSCLTDGVLWVLNPLLTTADEYELEDHLSDALIDLESALGVLGRIEGERQVVS